MWTIPRNTVVLVCDGRKALILRNVGNATSPNLSADHVMQLDNPMTHEQGADRPGRAFERARADRRSAVEMTDLHELREQRFARQIVLAVERIVHERDAQGLVVVAPPRTLAQLRAGFHPDIRSRILAEIGKDLTRHPIADIEKSLVE